MEADVTATAPDNNKRRLSILGEIGCPTMMPSYDTKGWRYPLRLPILVGHIPFRETTLPQIGGRLVRAPALVFDAVGSLQEKEKRTSGGNLSAMAGTHEECLLPAEPDVPRTLHSSPQSGEIDPKRTLAGRSTTYFLPTPVR
jgi:hypothetical protein